MKRIFVVEDEAVVALEIKDHLRTLGYEVCGHAAHGESALLQIPEARPDLVVMDINLGEGISGLEVAERIRAVINVPVIFLTAYSDAELTQRAGRSESFAYIVKPFDPLVLRANIELALVRHDAMVAVRERDAFNSSVLDALSEHIAVLDRQGVVVAVNKAWRRFAESNGAPPLAENFIGADYLSVCAQGAGHPSGEDAATAQAGIRAVMAGEQTEFRLEYSCHSPGEQRWFEMHVTPLRGSRAGVVIGHENITERKRSEARFVGVFEFAPDALFIVNEAGRIVQANRLAEQTFGYSRDELLQLTVEALVPEEDRPGHAKRRDEFSVQEQPRRMGSDRSRLRALRKDGTTVPVEISLSPLYSEEGRLIVAAIRDVTARARMEEDRAQLEDQLRQAQKMESLGTLAGGVAHDFNNLLAVIVNSLELARADAAPADPIARRLDQIAAAASRAGELVKQILAFSRRLPISRSVTSVRTVVEEVAGLLRATLPAGIRIVTDVGGDVPSVLIDSTRIHQVLMNLGTNAWQAIERNTGKITLHLGAVSVDASSLLVAGVEPGHYARIQVSDDGTGMDAATIERIFEPFFTTKKIGMGTGLGLAVVHGIITDHGGAITVDSVPGRGTTVSVYLPEAVGPASSPEPPQESVHRGAGRVLLIDDEEALVGVAGDLIERLGYQVTRFVRALDALDAVRADPGRFDVVVTDQNMPALGGLELARAISALRSDLPVVLISGNRLFTDDELAAANIQYRLDKPFTGASLGRVLARALKRS